MMAQAQVPSPIDGWRRTRWCVVRNTYRELQLTTVKSWLATFPPEVYGAYRSTPPFRQNIVDPATKLDMEIFFVALDRDDSLRALLGSEWTGIFFNEAREMSKQMVDQAVSRVRRFPSMEHGGPTRPGVIADTNAPATNHWWAYMSGEVPLPETMSAEERALFIRPRDWAFFSQPPALLEVMDAGRLIDYQVNPRAENLANLTPEYYRDQWQGKERAWVEVYLLNRYRSLRSGKPVYPQFREELHVSKIPLSLDPTLDTWVGIDFGLTPAAAVIQRTPLGQYLVVGELVTEDCVLPKFFVMLNTYLQSLGVDPESVRMYGDPSGDNRDQQGLTALSLARAAGLAVMPAPTNDISIRLGAVSGLLERLSNGVPSLVVAPQCLAIKQGFIDGYRYRRIQTKDGIYEEKPSKNKFSHCFAGDTPISVPGGSKAISKLRLGDMVKTPLGPRKVTATMSRVAETIRITFEDGREVVCTRDHPFLTLEGLVRADALQYALLQEEASCASTRKSGSKPTAQFRPATTSTTETTTAATMRSTIWSACRALSTRATTRASGWLRATQAWLAELQRPEKLPRLGTPLMLAGSGIVSMRSESPPPKYQVSTSASSVGRDTRQPSERRDTAPWLASQKPGVTQESTTKFDNAQSVERILQSVVTKKPASVVARVVESRQRVYDLTVDDAHCFYANNLLVSNCHDALQYALLGAGEGRVLMGSPLMASTQAVTTQRIYTPWRSKSRFGRSRQPNVW